MKKLALKLHLNSRENFEQNEIKKSLGKFIYPTTFLISFGECPRTRKAKPFEFVARSFCEESVKNLKLTKCGVGEKMESKDDDFGGGNSIYGGIKK